jgi:3-deoxy-D-manno-octulosonic-acid transferase
VGPHTFNFREIVSIFELGGAVKTVTAEALGAQQLSLLNHSEERQRMGRLAKELFAKHAGATRRTLDALDPFLKRQERAQ